MKFSYNQAARQATEVPTVSYTNLLYRIVYATKERAPLITSTLRPRLHEYLGGTVRGIGVIALEINGTNYHVHVLAKVRPTISVSEFLATYIDRRPPEPLPFALLEPRANSAKAT